MVVSERLGLDVPDKMPVVSRRNGHHDDEDRNIDHADYDASDGETLPRRPVVGPT